MTDILMLFHCVPYRLKNGNRVRSFRLLSQHKACPGTFMNRPDGEWPVQLFHRIFLNAHVGRIATWRANLYGLASLVMGRFRVLAKDHSQDVRCWVRGDASKHPMQDVAVSFLKTMQSMLVVRIFVDYADVKSVQCSQYATFFHWALSCPYRREVRVLMSFFWIPQVENSYA